MEEQEDEIFNTNEPSTAEDGAVWNRVQSKIRKKQFRKRWILSTTCLLVTTILTLTGVFLFRGEPQVVAYRLRELTLKPAEQTELIEFCKKKKLLLPDPQREVIDFFEVKVYDRENEPYAYRATYIYNGELHYTILMTADPHLDLEIREELLESALFYQAGDVRVKYFMSENVVECYASRESQQYYLEIPTDVRRIRPILDNLFGDRS